MILKQCLGKLHDNPEVLNFSGLTLIVTVTKESSPIVNVNLPENDEVLGCTIKQLSKSGFPMKIVKYGFPLKALADNEQKAFQVTQEQDRFAVHITLGERGRIYFERSKTRPL